MMVLINQFSICCFNPNNEFSSFLLSPLKKLFNPINIANTLTKMTTLPCGIVIDPKLFQYCSSARLKLNLKLNFLSLASVEKKFFFLETAASRW